MKQYLLIVLIILAHISFSQSIQKNGKKYQFETGIVVGPVDGEKGTSVLMQSISGIKYKSYFIGLGVGLDYYFIRTIPVFVEFRKTLIAKHNSVFLFGDAGYAYPWASSNNKLMMGQMNLSCGHMLSGGVGYQISAFKSSFLQFRASYSYKQIKQTINGWPTINDPRVDWLDYSQHYNYKMNRLAIGMGLIF